MLTATIFDIERNSFVDGPGIRTTVFFKGCNLKCVWCHNPESQDFKPQMMFYKDKCKDCGKCKQVCPYNFQKCDLCGKCTFYCPVDARKVCGKEYTVDEVFDEIIKDKSYYDNSDGGVTFSGGECMLQVDFLKEILKKCKENGIHTAVDTCGFVSRESIDKVLPYTDLFLYDIKAIDEDVHIKCTGKSNIQILENLKYIDSKNKEIEIRIPYVPNFNDNQIDKIAEFLKSLKNVKAVKVLPYHNYAGSKYLALGMENTLPKVLPDNKKIELAQNLFK